MLTLAEARALQAQEHGLPLTGYRWWGLYLVTGGYTLGPVSRPEWRDWQPEADGWATARCHCTGAPGAPRPTGLMPRGLAAEHLAVAEGWTRQPGNGCGFYAFADLHGALQYLPEVGRDRCAVLGEVELGGTIAVHENGYRAARARVQCLYGPALGWVWVLHWKSPSTVWYEGEYEFRQPLLCRVAVVGLPIWPLDLPTQVRVPEARPPEHLPSRLFLVWGQRG